MSKKRRKGRISTVRRGEAPTPERRNLNGGVRAEIVDRDANDKILVRRYKAVWECPLDIYLERGRISEAEHKAGIKFRHAYFRAVPRVKIVNLGSGSHGSSDMAAVMAVHSMQLLNAAYEVLSPKQKAIVVNVCGHDEVAGNKERLKTLHRGLEKLTELWRL